MRCVLNTTHLILIYNLYGGYNGLVGFWNIITTLDSFADFIDYIHSLCHFSECGILTVKKIGILVADEELT